MRIQSDDNFTYCMTNVSIFAFVKLQFNRLSSLSRYFVVALLFVAMFTSLTSYTFFEQSHCTSIECEMDVDLNEVESTKPDSQFPFDLDFLSFVWVPFYSVLPVKILFHDQKQVCLPKTLVKRYIAFHSLKIFC